MENGKNLKQMVLSSLFWKLMERSGVQGVQFLVQIVLARILFPEDYGLIAIVTIFILLANVFIESSFNTALIQKKGADELDFSSVFYLNLAISILLYVILFFSAPYIALFYNEPQLILVIKVLSLTLLFGSLYSVQNAFVAKKMLFKNLFLSSFGAIITSGIVGISGAYLGWGLWALVAQQLTYKIMVTSILWFTVRWRPRLLFSFIRIKRLFSFGWKILLSALLITISQNIIGLIIGKISNPAMLGFYNRGKQFPELFVHNINGSIQSVLFPALASEQDNPERVKGLLRRSLITSSFVVFPMMVLLFSIAEPLIILLLTDKWLPAVPFLQIFCVIYALMPIHTVNLQAINALGKSDIYLKLEIIKKTLEFIVLLITIEYGIYAIVLGQLLISVIATFINAYPTAKLLNYGFREQLVDIVKNLLLALVMGGVLFLIKFNEINPLMSITLQVFLGIIVYISLAYLFKIDSLTYLVKTIKQRKTLRSV